jgi:1-deoxy-D-xylulose-5-phosphate reductoisomerase
MAGIVGIAGLAPTLAAAVSNGADIALANKECLVSAGDLFTAAIAKGGGKLLPVDSEHKRDFQVLEEHQRHAVERIILTASGGPFRDFTREQMAPITPEIAAAHPNWSMGIKISIDSASMFNKALEMIEARHLFGMRPEQIEVIVHPQSIIHSMVGYSDGSVLAQLGAPDMRHAIGYAISHPRRASLPVERLDFAKLSRLDFQAPMRPASRLWRLPAPPCSAADCRVRSSTAPRKQRSKPLSQGRSGFWTWPTSLPEPWTEWMTAASRTASRMSMLPIAKRVTLPPP